MNYKIIKTGSKGNATVIEDFILLDCGVKFDLIKDYYEDLKVIIITHIHSDHFYKPTIKKLAQIRPSLKFIVRPYLVPELLKLGVLKQNILIFPLSEWINLNVFECKLDLIPHDVENVAVHIKYNDKFLLYATDTSSLKDVYAKDYDYYFIEGNYKEDEIEERKEQKILNGEFFIEDRIINSHLSHEKCIEYFMRMSKETSILEIMHKHVGKEEKLL